MDFRKGYARRFLDDEIDFASVLRTAPLFVTGQDRDLSLSKRIGNLFHYRKCNDNNMFHLAYYYFLPLLSDLDHLLMNRLPSAKNRRMVT